jgi:hypothetical protein
MADGMAGGPAAFRFPAARVAAAAALATGLPLAVRFFLNSRLSLLWVLVPAAVTVGSSILHQVYGRKVRWLGIVSTGSIFVFAFLLLVGIMITPYSAYRMWFYSMQTGSPRGSVSNIFVLAATFFAALLSPAVLPMGYLWTLMVLGLVILYLLAMIFASPLFFLLILLLMAASLLLMAGRHNGDPAGASFPLFLMALSLALAFLFAGDRNPQGSRLIDRTIYPVLRDAVLTVLPGFPLIYEIPGYGYSYNEKKLGGRPVLSDNPIFEVEGRPGEALYLRTRIYDYYEGDSWKIAVPDFDANLYRINWQLFSRRYSGEHDLRVTLAVDFYNSLPHTLDTRHVRFESDLPEVEWGHWAGGFNLDPPLQHGDTLLLARAEEAEGELRNPEGREPGRLHYPPSWSDPQSYITLSEVMRAMYLQVPEELPQNVRALASRLAGKQRDPETILRSIQEYLAANYSYSLSPRESKDATDFVQGFLFGEGTGYCVHFASSFVMLARLNGIPARYATGFLVYIPGGDTRATVTGLAAHAWPEVWLEDRGWVTWEATTAVDPGNYRRGQDDLIYDYGINLDPLTTRQIEALLGASVESAGQKASGPAGAPPERKTRGPAGPIAAAAAAVLLLLTGLRFRPSLAALIPGGDRRVPYRMDRLLHRLRRQGLPDPARCGWVAWCGELERRIPSARREIEAFRRALLRWAYRDSPRRPGGPDRAAVSLLIRQIESFRRRLKSRPRVGSSAGRAERDAPASRRKPKVP